MDLDHPKNIMVGLKSGDQLVHLLSLWPSSPGTYRAYLMSSPIHHVDYIGTTTASCSGSMILRDMELSTSNIPFPLP